MKKWFTFTLAVVLVVCVLSGCAGQPSAPSASPTDTTPTSTTAAPDAIDDYGTPDIQTAAHKETATYGDSNIEYVQLIGLPDIEVQEYLNNQIKIFCEWPTVDQENPDKTVTVTANYTIIGKYISIRTTDLTTIPGAAYPVSNVRGITFNLQDGEHVSLNLVIDGTDGLHSAITNGKLKQIEPDSIVPGAADKFAQELNAYSEFYLTKTAICFPIQGENHTTGDYWVFEAKYNDIKESLTPDFAKVLD